MWQVGDKLGRFRLDREIGQGSHGVVWIATDTALDAPVAVKILHPWLTQDTAVRDRFKRELLLARRVAHPGVCRLFDLHEEGDAFFITMDYVEGQTLLNILKNEGRLEPQRATRILRGVCQALAAAHGAGVIHRDLKPANIIVRAGDNPMILDFGTATASDVSRVTRPGTAVGSMRFIAPEIFTGVAPSIRTDIYSLGVVAYVTLAGKLPYNAAAGAIEMLEMIRNQPPQRIDIIQPDVPPRLADVVARSMEKNPDARFASAQAFDEALGEVERLFDLTKASGPAKGGTGDFARWAPSAVIREVVNDAKTASHPPPPLPPENTNETPLPAQRTALVEPPSTATNPMQAGQTVVDARMPDLSLGAPVPSSPSSEMPLVTGAAIVVDPSLMEPKTDETPRPTSVPTDPSIRIMGDTIEQPEEPPLRPLEPTVRIAKIDLDMAEAAALGKTGVDKRLIAAGAAVVAVIIVVAGVAIGKGGGGGVIDAGVVAVLPAVVDAGDKPAAEGEGEHAVKPAGEGEGEAAVKPAGEGEGEAAVKPAGEGEGEAKAAAEGEGEDGMHFDAPPTARPHADPKIEGVIAQTRKAMLSKGILAVDMPAVEQQLDKAHALNARGKHVDADKLAQAAKAAVDGQSVDRGFVIAKLGRFNKAYDKSKRPDIADKVEPLAREAGNSLAAGQYDVANKKLNRAFGLVAKPK